MVHMGQTKMVRQRSGGFFRINRKDRVSRVISIHYCKRLEFRDIILRDGHKMHMYNNSDFVSSLLLVFVLFGEVRYCELKVQVAIDRGCRFGSWFGGVT